jgi:hypothetical protein
MSPTVIIIVLLLVVVAYYVLVVKGPKPLSIAGFADDNVVVALNGATILSNNGWNKRFNWDGTAKPGDILLMTVTNTGGPGGMVCKISFNGVDYVSSPSLFKTTSSMNAISADNVKSWWSANDISSLGGAHWVWSGTGVDSASLTNTFTFVLP